MMLIGTVRGQNLSELADKKYKIDTSLQPKRGKIFDISQDWDMFGLLRDGGVGFR